MAYLEISELKTHLYAEIVDEISREDDEIIQSAIDAAIAEVKGYVSQYDKAAIFDATGANRNPIVLMYTKDIAVWHYINLCNVDVDYEERKERYKNATDWLGKVQSGKVVPELPVATVETTTEGEGFVKFGSNPKRNNHF